MGQLCYLMVLRHGQRKVFWNCGLEGKPPWMERSSTYLLARLPAAGSCSLCKIFVYLAVLGPIVACRIFSLSCGMWDLVP